MTRVRIFQVAFDPSLLRVRAEMLKHAGFEVSSALGFAEAQHALAEKPDCQLVVVGWSGTDTARREIVQWLKARWPGLRVMALHNSNGHAIAEADFNSCSDNPEEWFAAVKRVAAAAA